MRTLNLLHGTSLMPKLDDSILFIEDDYLVFPEIFDRDLQSLTSSLDKLKQQNTRAGRIMVANRDFLNEAHHFLVKRLTRETNKFEQSEKK